MIAQTVLQPVSEVPLHVTILFYVAVVFLALILFLLLRVSGQLREVSYRLKKSARSESSTRTESSSATDPESPAIEVGPGTPFEKFLNEDPAHRMLSKKEQFKAYRKWRAEKGLNWSA